MTDGTQSLVLELLRGMRAEIADTRAELNTRISALEDKMDRGFATLGQRLDTMQLEVRGVTYVVTAAIGSVPADINDLRERVTRLEKV